MIVITGPNGNVGTELVERLVAQHDLPFRIAAHNPDKLYRLYGRDVPVAKFDFDDQTTWPATLEGITSLFLLFPLPHPVTARERMIPFVDAAVKAGCKHIVYVSVPIAGWAKFVPHYPVERHIETCGIPYTFLRGAFFTQNLCRDISTHHVDIAERNEIFVPAGDGKTAFLDSRDVADAALVVFRNTEAHRNKAYTLTGPEKLSYGEVAKILTEELGRPIRYAKPGLIRWIWRYWRRQVGWDVMIFMIIAYTLTRIGRNEPQTPDLAQLLGQPGRTVRDFARDYRHRFTPQAAAATLKWVQDVKDTPRWRTGR